jgi:alkylation response protein AidB-like acyl-CoA dehydrogenase
LNGQKIFPGPSGPPELFQRKLLKGHLGYLVVGTTEPVADKRNWDTIGIFYVPPDAQGLGFSTPYQKMGCTVEYNRDIHFDDVRIPKEYRLAGPGFDAALYYATILAGCKLGEACRLVGLAAGLFDKVLDNTLHREIDGRPLREYSLWAAIIGEMAEKIFAGRAMYMYATYAATHPDIYGKMWDQDGTNGICGGAKDVCGQNFRWIADKAMDVHGGYGYCCEFGLEKILRDGEIIVLGPGGPQRDKLDMALMYYPRQWSGKAEPFEGWTP